VPFYAFQKGNIHACSARQPRSCAPEGARDLLVMVEIVSAKEILPANKNVDH